ncbi:MAG: Kelch repeat-containing protein [Acidimicrobiales bacterium]
MRRTLSLLIASVLVTIALPSLSESSASATAPTWQLLANPAPGNPGAMFLMTNGQVLVEDQGPLQSGSPNWWLLTPTSSGSYVNGTWSTAASMPNDYSPVYFASAVLPDGRFLVEGGEFNGTSTFAGTNQGAIYDPVANTWTAVSPPNGGQGCWAHIADAPATVLANGTFLLGASGTRTSTCEALFNESTLTWTPTGAGKADPNPEEGFTLMPDGNVLDVNTGTSPTILGGTRNSEIYNATTGTWSSAGNTPVALDNNNAEIGPASLMPSGQIFAEGATGATALFNTTSSTWSAGPQLPVVDGAQMTATDACSAVLPDGNVLFNASPNQAPPTAWYTFNGTSISSVANDVAMPASKEQSNYCNALVLPTGQVLVDDRLGPNTLEVYNGGGTPENSWLPVVTSLPSTITAGSTETLNGTQLSGLDQGSYFGDDLTNATNYPLLQVTNTQTHQVTYARTSGFTYMGVAPGTASSAQFILPTNADNGPATARVITNGIASTPQRVTVTNGTTVRVKVKAKRRPPRRRVTLVCVRHGVVRRVSGFRPRCPAGYQRR